MSTLVNKGLVIGRNRQSQPPALIGFLGLYGILLPLFNSFQEFNLLQVSATSPIGLQFVLYGSILLSIDVGTPVHRRFIQRSQLFCFFCGDGTAANDVLGLRGPGRLPEGGRNSGSRPWEEPV